MVRDKCLLCEQRRRGICPYLDDDEQGLAEYAENLNYIKFSYDGSRVLWCKAFVFFKSNVLSFLCFLVVLFTMLVETDVAYVTAAEIVIRGVLIGCFGWLMLRLYRPDEKE